MPIVCVTEAIALSGKSSSTVFRDLREGKLSRASDGSRGIDTTELLRVYKTLHDTTKKTAMPLPVESVADSSAWFIKRIEQLETKIEAQRIDFQQRENRMMTLLEHKDDRDNRILELLEHKDNRESFILEKLEKSGTRFLESLERKIASPTLLSFFQNMIKPKA